MPDFVYHVDGTLDKGKDIQIDLVQIEYTSCNRTLDRKSSLAHHNGMVLRCLPLKLIEDWR